MKKLMLIIIVAWTLFELGSGMYLACICRPPFKSASFLCHTIYEVAVVFINFTWNWLLAIFYLD